MPYFSRKPDTEAVFRTLSLAVFLGLPSLVFFYSSHFHEPWRDELQAFLMGRNSSSLLELFQNVRYEGHPPLVHLIFFVTSRILPVPYALTALAGMGSLVLCLGIYLTSYQLSHQNRWIALLVTALVGSSYTAVYEMGVVVRGYGLGTGLMLIGWLTLFRGLAQNHRRPVVVGSVCLGLASLTVVHTLVGSVCAWLSCLILCRKSEGVGRYWGLSSICAVPFFLGSLFLLSPFLNRIGPNVYLFCGSKELQLREGFVSEPFFWHFNLRAWWGSDRVFTRRAFVLLVLGAVFALGYRSKEKSVQTYSSYLGLFALGLSYIFAFEYRGNYRHFSVIVVPLLVITLTTFLVWLREARTVPFRSGLMLLLMAGWIGVEASNLKALVLDLQYPFSPGKEAALTLPPNAVVVAGEREMLLSNIAYWNPTVKLIASRPPGRPFTFVRWDRARCKIADRSAIVKNTCERYAGRPVYLASHRWEVYWRESCSRFLSIPPTVKTANRSEYIVLEQVDCECVHKKNREGQTALSQKDPT